uniref:ShKT domain-containing protein n=1 Tax=Panagrolaimus sp. JU765 TaxID=591449 RepID=A0AC34Q033_9BILA
MTDQCAATCNRCTSAVTTAAPCVGVASNCAANANLCSNTIYYSLMTQQCAMTCGRCSSLVTTKAPCVDKINPTTGVSDCPGAVQYCNNSLYYFLMIQQCPKKKTPADHGKVKYKHETVVLEHGNSSRLKKDSGRPWQSEI